MILILYNSHTFRSTHSNQETTSTDENVIPSNKKLLNVFAQIKDFEKYVISNHRKSPLIKYSFFFTYFRGFESETDTEEYEKIGQMSIDKKPTLQSMCVGTIQPEYCDMATNMSIVLKQDNEMVTDVSIYLFHESRIYLYLYFLSFRTICFLA